MDASSRNINYSYTEEKKQYSYFKGEDQQSSIQQSFLNCSTNTSLVPLKNPNKKFKKKIQDASKELNDNHIEINNIFKFIESEFTINIPGLKELREEKESIHSKLKLLQEEFDSMKVKSYEFDKRLKELLNERNGIKNDVNFPVLLENLNYELNLIDNQLSYSILSQHEESILAKKKETLGALRPKAAQLSKVNKNIIELKVKYDTELKKSKLIEEELNEVSERFESIKNTILKLEEDYKENNDYLITKEKEITRISLRNEYLESNIKMLKDELRQKSIEYSKQQQEIANQVQLNTDKKRTQSSMKKEQLRIKEDERLVVIQGLEIYFKNLLIITEEASPRNDDHFIALQDKITSNQVLLENNKNVIESGTEVSPRKKQLRIPKQKPNKHIIDALFLDINIIRKIKELKLHPPNFKHEIDSFLRDLEKTRVKILDEVAASERDEHTPNITNINVSEFDGLKALSSANVREGLSKFRKKNKKKDKNYDRKASIISLGVKKSSLLVDTSNTSISIEYSLNKSLNYDYLEENLRGLFEDNAVYSRREENLKLYSKNKLRTSNDQPIICTEQKKIESSCDRGEEYQSKSKEDGSIEKDKQENKLYENKCDQENNEYNDSTEVDEIPDEYNRNEMSYSLRFFINSKKSLNGRLRKRQISYNLNHPLSSRDNLNRNGRYFSISLLGNETSFEYKNGLDISQVGAYTLRDYEYADITVNDENCNFANECIDERSGMEESRVWTTRIPGLTSRC